MLVLAGPPCSAWHVHVSCMPGGTPQQPNGSLVEHPLQVWLKEPEIAQSSEPSLFTTLGGCTCPGAQNEVQSESSREDAFVEPSAASHAVHVRVPPATSQPEQAGERDGELLRPRRGTPRVARDRVGPGRVFDAPVHFRSGVRVVPRRRGVGGQSLSLRSEKIDCGPILVHSFAPGSLWLDWSLTREC